MKRREVTADMVERAKEAYRVGWNKPGYFEDKVIRGVLEAALNPPPDSGIPVSEKMKEAALKWAKEHRWIDNTSFGNAYAELYQTMERVRREEARTIMGAHWHLRLGDPHPLSHRRSTDK